MPSEAAAAETLTFGDIVLVAFPFTDLMTTKRRPAVVVSSRAYNLARPDVMVMAVTSQLRPTPGLGEVPLSAWEAAGLLKPSAIKPIVATLERALILRRLGSLNDEDQSALRQALTQVLG